MWPYTLYRFGLNKGKTTLFTKYKQELDVLVTDELKVNFGINKDGTNLPIAFSAVPALFPNFCSISLGH